MAEKSGQRQTQESDASADGDDTAQTDADGSTATDGQGTALSSAVAHERGLAVPVGPGARTQSGIQQGRVPGGQSGASRPDGRVPYDAGPDPETLSARYDMPVHSGDAKRLQRLESTHGSEQVSRWAAEGMTVETMGRPHDMEAFRERQADRSAEVPRDIERRNRASVQRNTARNQDDGPAGETDGPEMVRRVVSSPGRSMDETVQREMESKMGGDFSDVRIHTGPDASAAAESIDARAFTVGNHVAFKRGEYDPDSESGKKVLAHELTHVRQQTDGRVSLLPEADAGNPGVSGNTQMYVQPKLEVSSPDDPAEQEAREVAEQVMGRGERDSQRAATGTAEHDTRRPDAETVESSEETQQNVFTRTVPARRAAASDGEMSEGRELSVRSAVQGSGRELPSSTQSEMESKMGADLSDVSVHTGSEADAAAKSIGAEAYTIGSDIAFSKGSYNPQSQSGKRLLAHELAHTVQQTGGDASRLAGSDNSNVSNSPGDSRSVAPQVHRSSADSGGSGGASRMGDRIVVRGPSGLDGNTHEKETWKIATSDFEVEADTEKAVLKAAEAKGKEIVKLSTNKSVQKENYVDGYIYTTRERAEARRKGFEKSLKKIATNLGESYHEHRQLLGKGPGATVENADNPVSTRVIDNLKVWDDALAHYKRAVNALNLVDMRAEGFYQTSLTDWKTDFSYGAMPGGVRNAQFHTAKYEMKRAVEATNKASKKVADSAAKKTQEGMSAITTFLFWGGVTGLAVLATPAEAGVLVTMAVGGTVYSAGTIAWQAIKVGEGVQEEIPWNKVTVEVLMNYATLGIARKLQPVFGKRLVSWMDNRLRKWGVYIPNLNAKLVGELIYNTVDNLLVNGGLQSMLKQWASGESKNMTWEDLLLYAYNNTFSAKQFAINFVESLIPIIRSRGTRQKPTGSGESTGNGEMGVYRGEQGPGGKRGQGMKAHPDNGSGGGKSSGEPSSADGTKVGGSSDTGDKSKKGSPPDHRKSYPVKPQEKKQHWERAIERQGPGAINHDPDLKPSLKREIAQNKDGVLAVPKRGGGERLISRQKYVNDYVQRGGGRGKGIKVLENPNKFRQEIRYRKDKMPDNDRQVRQEMHYRMLNPTGDAKPPASMEQSSSGGPSGGGGSSGSGGSPTDAVKSGNGPSDGGEKAKGIGDVSLPTGSVEKQIKQAIKDNKKEIRNAVEGD